MAPEGSHGLDINIMLPEGRNSPTRNRTKLLLLYTRLKAVLVAEKTLQMTEIQGTIWH